MKTRKAPFLILSFFILFLTVDSLAQNATAEDRKYILDHLSTFYVPTVNATAGIPGNKYERLDISGKKNTANSFFGDKKNANNAIADSVLRAIYNDPDKRGDSKLQFIISKILRIRGVNIMLIIFEDQQPLTQAAVDTFGICPSYNHVWFCANNVPPSANSPFKGFVMMGTYWITQRGAKNVNGTICHELVHTQDQTNWYSHSFDIYSPGTTDPTFLPYGADKAHYMAEAVPEMLAAYKEAVANASRYIYYSGQLMDKSYLNSLMWFSDGCLIQVEKNNYSPILNPHASADNWLYSQLTNSGVPPYMQNSNYAVYFLRDLKNYRIAMHNESIIAMVISTYNEYIGYANFYTTIGVVGKSNGNLAQYMNELCGAEIPESKYAKPESSSEQNVFPLALADYLTHYKTSSKAEFKRMFDDLTPGSTQLNDTYVNTYWGVRDELMGQLKDHSNRATCVDLEMAKTVYTEDFNTIAQRLNIKTR